MRTCEWCGKSFEPTEDAAQVYCTRTHRVKANRARQKIKTDLATAGNCPTPYKRVYVNNAHAEARHLPANQYLYHCACGAIHSATIRRAA